MDSAAPAELALVSPLSGCSRCRDHGRGLAQPGCGACREPETGGAGTKRGTRDCSASAQHRSGRLREEADTALCLSFPASPEFKARQGVTSPPCRAWCKVGAAGPGAGVQHPAGPAGQAQRAGPRGGRRGLRPHTCPGCARCVPAIARATVPPLPPRRSGGCSTTSLGGERGPPGHSTHLGAGSPHVAGSPQPPLLSPLPRSHPGVGAQPAPAGGPSPAPLGPGRPAAGEDGRLLRRGECGARGGSADADPRCPPRCRRGR